MDYPVNAAGSGSPYSSHLKSNGYEDGTDEDQEQEVPTLPNQLLQLSPGARRVTDADEEIFLLYTLTPALAGRYGLGQVDSKHDLLTITFDLDKDDPPEVSSRNSDSLSSSATRSRKDATSKVARGSKRQGLSTGSKSSKNATSSARDTTVNTLLFQDSTSLRSNAGDTGSVIWRSSLYLAACLTRQLYRPQRGDEPLSLLNRKALLNPKGEQEDGRINILELGTGTGVLPAILLPFLQTRRLANRLHWTATDLEELLPLIRRNLSDKLSSTSSDSEEGGITLSSLPLDWMHASNLLHSSTSYAGGSEALRRSLLPSSLTGYPDLLMAVDCIFNPSLFDPLLDTIDLFTLKAHTVVLLLVELRSAEAMREFMEGWLKRDGGWRVWSVDVEQMKGMEKGYVIWVGWKE
ncbi:hypothetical protein BCV69DRAFT_309531 [Microstroma glucosiphilum]|uniref:Uncharacterized protein n=1 Tax=Pseudomicrostroma glucosiphilum TaxID=1684307 RepID=A0A316UH45_9BASI|nr:hypothetical protein BCV69DRAFT_309531 [Pseudomicrostroma glucosiphilum]PWN23651.1 hypothetical protein BCV69DRAFT_309531 [Pseudomicrostroma glucosiphilum]